MNTGMAPTACATLMPALTGANGNYYTPAAVIVVEPQPVRVQADERPVSAEEVESLIQAAGPLSVRDIAGGLGVTVAAALSAVRGMIVGDCLRQDEWGRLSLAPGCGT